MRRTLRVLCILAWVFREWLAGLLASEREGGRTMSTFRGVLECPGNPHDADAVIILRTLDRPLILNLTPSMQQSIANTVNSRKLVEISGELVREEGCHGPRIDVAGWSLF